MSVELPVGFGMALAMNEAAMKTFETMTEQEKNSIVQKAHEVQSKSEMQQLVNSLLSGATQ